MKDLTAKRREEIRALAMALATGEVSAGERSLSAFGLDESACDALALDVMRYIQERGTMLSLDMRMLATMQWLTMEEAEAYTRRGRKVLIAWIQDGKVTAYKGEGQTGGYVLHRPSIDAHMMGHSLDRMAAAVEMVTNTAAQTGAKIDKDAARRLLSIALEEAA